MHRCLSANGPRCSGSAAIRSTHVKKIILAFTTLLVTATPAFAGSGNTSTATGTAAATIVAPIVLTHSATSSLNFGRLTRGTGGTVTVTAAGVGSVGSDVSIVPGSTTTADSFTVAGDASRSFSVTTSGGTVASGGTSLSFTTTPSAAAGTLSAGGAASFTVGGTLTVTGTAPTGAYSGTYTATVTYN